MFSYNAGLTSLSGKCFDYQNHAHTQRHSLHHVHKPSRLSPTFFFVTKAGGGTLERRGDPGNEANIIHQSQSITVFGYYMQVKVIVSKRKRKETTTAD